MPPALYVTMPYQIYASYRYRRRRCRRYHDSQRHRRHRQHAAAMLARFTVPPPYRRWLPSYDTAFSVSEVAIAIHVIIRHLLPVNIFIDTLQPALISPASETAIYTDSVSTPLAIRRGRFCSPPYGTFR
jgi:hypothetical protein